MHIFIRINLFFTEEVSLVFALISSSFLLGLSQSIGFFRSAQNIDLAKSAKELGLKIGTHGVLSGD